MKDETKRWVEAGTTLGKHPGVPVKCPVCQQGNLEVQDQMLGGGKFERHMRCPRCGAYNSMRMSAS
jgi:ssDNA-binding Zn-finger/Zn-ribbon topoisomerase 1